MSIDKVVDLVKNKNYEEFKLFKDKLPEDPTIFLEHLDEADKETLVDWCREIRIYLIHKLFAKETKVYSLTFIKDNLSFYKKSHLRDDEDKTWLHIAVKYNRSKEILNFLVEDLEVSVDKVDINKYTALHIACQKQTYTEGELDILIKQSNQLVAQSFDDVTPIELACGDLRKIKDIKRNKIVQLNEILRQIDRIWYGLPETDEYHFNDKISTETLWLNLLQKNNKYRLIYYMKKDPKFHEKYYLTSDEILGIVSSCHENGEGILTYVKKKYFKENSEATLEEIFTDLSGLKLDKDITENAADNIEVFYKSTPFLAIITGRFELVSPLLTYNQFDVISYGLLICLICQKLSLITEFPEQVINNIRRLKDFCEKYSIAVLNRTVIRDLTVEKKTISGFLNKAEKLAGQRILDIAYLGKCAKFLSLPSCQETLTNLWYERGKKCPALKFYLHSTVHIIFLGLLSYILVHNFLAKASVIEIICYVYGLGYLFEEIRQIYLGHIDSGYEASYGKDASNYLDMGSLLFMLLSVILRLSLTIDSFENQGNDGLFIESKDPKLFWIRLLLCLSLILFFMRIIYFGSIFEQLGPKLKMIGKMIVSDLIPLIFIFFVFIASFGVAFQSLLFPNGFYSLKNTNNSYEKKSKTAIFGHIFRRSALTIFDTHYPFEEMEHDEGGYLVNSEGKTAVYFLLIIYMVVVNIMLTNLLIALFSYTVTVIIQKSRESWKAKRYKDIKEYYDRSLCPPPFNILEILIEIILVVIKKKRSSKIKKTVPNEEEMKILENKNDVQKTQFMSFKILQAFALKDCRYKLVQTEEDIVYENKIDIKSIKKGIERIEKVIKDQSVKTIKQP